MEELQDAIEDAQYVNAISAQDDGPRPVLPWEIPTAEQLEVWKAQKDITLDYYLCSAIGLFLFSAFLKDNCNDHVRINFVEDVIRCRRLKSRHRVDKAKRIIITYFKTPTNDSFGNVILPAKTEIDEYELERPVAKVADIKQLFEKNMDPTNAVCLLGLDGPLLDEILTGFQEIEKSRAAYKKERALTLETSLYTQLECNNFKIPKEIPTTKEAEPAEAEEGSKGTETKPDPEEAKANMAQQPEQSAEEMAPVVDKIPVGETKDTSKIFPQIGRDESVEGLINIPDSFFDKVEAVVVEGLRQQYWDEFLVSEQHTKLLNFLWYQDRTVVPEDFFVMRVLGRGGFGLVTGK